MRFLGKRAWLAERFLESGGGERFERQGENVAMGAKALEDEVLRSC
jgi:hypothetical protein